MGRDAAVDALQLEKVTLSSRDGMTSFRGGYVDRENLAFCVYSAGGSVYNTYELYGYWNWGTQIAEKLQGSTKATYFCQDGGCGVAEDGYDGRGGWDDTDAARWIHIVGIEQVMESVAASLTNLTVATGDGPQIAGLVGESIIHVRVRWGWLALPAGLSLSAALLLLVTMMRTWQKGSPMWKASLFPLLFHGLDDEGRSQTVQWGAGEDQTANYSVRVSEMAVAASETRVRLKAAEGDGDSGKLLLST